MKRDAATILALGFFLLAALLTKHAPVSWNDSSRMATIDSLVERRTFAIDRSSIETGDKYRYHGAFYSDKPAMLAIAGAGVALALKSAAGVSLARNPRLAYYLITLSVVGVSYAVGLAVLYRTLRAMSVATAWAACVTITAGAGTLLLPYATIFNNHIVSGALIAIGFASARKAPGRRIDSAVAGATFALAAAIDIAFATFFVLAPILLAKNGLRRTLPPFLAAAAPVIAAYFALNVVLSGSLLPPAMNAPLWKYAGSEFDGSNLSGLASHHSPAGLAHYAFGMLLGDRGLFSYMPILLLGAYGLVRGFRTKPALRTDFAFIAIGCAAYVGMYIFTSNNYSGWSYGVRWWAGIVFLAIVPLGALGEEIARSTRLRRIFVATASASIAIAVLGLVNLIPAPGPPPLLANAHDLIVHRHALKIGAMVLFTLATTLLVARLAGSGPRKRLA